MRTALALCTLWSLFLPAHAWEPTDKDFHVIDKSVRHPQVRAWRKVHKPKSEQVRVVIRLPKPEEELCKPSIRVVGDQGLSLDKAQGEAVKNFTAMTRWKYGERYSSYDNARDRTMECNQSSIPVTGGVVGNILPKEIRCEIIAMPCRSKPEDGK